MATGAGLTSQRLSEQEAYEIARDAYVYAYPLLLMDLSVKQATNFAAPTGMVTQAPFNQFSHARAFPPADRKTAVRADVDTLHSVANLDLGPAPFVLSLPAIDRYFVLPLVSLWTEVFAVLGTRTTGGNTPRAFLITGPAWQGAVPSGLELIRSPTRIATIAGRTQTDGAADYENVHKIQAGYKVTPLGAWSNAEYVLRTGSVVDPTADMRTPSPAQVEQFDAVRFFGRFAQLLKDNPPGPLDYPMIHRLERLGFKVGQGFDLTTAPPDIRGAFEEATADGRALVARLGKQAAGEGGRGWVYNTRSADFGSDYRYRAAVAYCALGMNLPQDAVHPSLTNDEDGKPLDGRNNYVLRFENDKLPPVDGFWSLTAYDADGYFIPNALNRQALGDRSGLVSNVDASFDLFIRADSPGEAREPNWLPVARAPFTLVLRLYSPRVEVLDRTWTPPPVTKA
jgi:hypothetical protein